MENKKKRNTLDDYLGVREENTTVILLIAILTSFIVNGILAIISPVLGIYSIYFAVKQRNNSNISRNTKILRLVLIIVWLLAYGFFQSLKNNSQLFPTNPSQNFIQNNSGWQTFDSKDEGFKIDFPKYPEKETSPESDVNGIKVNSVIYTSNESEKESYLVAVYSYDIAPRDYDVKKGLERMLNGFINSIKGANLSSSTPTTYGSYQAVNFTVSSLENHIAFNGTIIVRDDLPTIRAYLLVSGATADVESKHQKFTNSFSLY